jgi:hypothetical protein
MAGLGPQTALSRAENGEDDHSGRPCVCGRYGIAWAVQQPGVLGLRFERMRSSGCADRPRPFELAGIYAMNGFLRATFNGQKFQGLFINTALGNFAGYVAGSLVTVLSTRQAVERRAVTNLFGVLPRKKIVVHVLPHWLEWLLALIVGFLVMEAVRYWFNHRKYLTLLSALRPKGGTESRLRAGRPEPGEQHVSDGGVPQEALPKSGEMGPLEPT